MELLVIFILTLLNGFFALSEIALVSLKKSRIQQLASQGSKNARLVLKLLENPENFLSSVQVGITLIGIISGAYGGATLTDDMVIFMTQFSFLGEAVYPISLVVVIGGITYFTIVLGELVPKTIAMNNPENIALFCVPIINVFTKLTFPFVRLLSITTKFILKICNIKENKGDNVSEEELRYILKVAGKEGVLENQESQAMQNLISFTDQTARSLMTHISEVEWINYSWPKEVIFDKIKDSVHSRFLVSDGNVDNVKGIVTIKDLLEHLNNPGFSLDDFLMKPIYVTNSTTAFKILDLFKNRKQYLGVVIDEFGGVRGIITLHDLIEAIVGDLPDEDESEEEENIIERKGEGYLINGRTTIWELNQYFATVVIDNKMENYTTISGFMIDQLKALPRTGDIVDLNVYTFEVMDMDGVRIDKILMSEKF